MKCPICKKETDSSSVFCTVCGKKIPRCPSCGTVLYQRGRFCENDGTMLPEELFAGLPPEPGAARPVTAAPPVSAPVSASGGQAPQPPQLPKKEKSKGAVIAAVAVAVLLLAAIAGGCFFFRDDLNLFFGAEKTDVPAVSGDHDQDEPEEEPEDDPVEAALEKAQDHADSGDYEKALREIQSALEKNPRSKKLQSARSEYIAAFESDVLAQAEVLADGGDFPAAIQAIRAAAEALDEESVQLADRGKEYEQLYIASITAKVDQLTEERRLEEARAQLNTAAALFPENEVLSEKLRQIQAAQAESGQASSISSISADAVASVEATSYLVQSNYGLHHTADRTLDGDLSTAWVEGADGDGIGESITYIFDGTYLVSGMYIYAGYQKSEELYDRNARPAILTVTFSNGEEQTAVLQDVNGLQDIAFDVPAETDSVKLTIASVYPGSKYEDTVISEISFY